MYEHLGGEPGTSQSRLVDFLKNAADPTNPTDAEKATAIMAAREEYLAISFLMKSDKKRYGSLLVDVENEYTRGIDSYPKTLSKAYDMLVNYRSAQPHRGTTSIQEGGVAYALDGEQGGPRRQHQQPSCGGRAIEGALSDEVSSMMLETSLVHR